MVKGSIADTICATHFNAAGWNVAETGIEHIVPNFAQRDRKSDKTNEHRIQEHIGHLPDLLVHRPARSHYLIEVKFRASIVTDDDLESFVGNLLFHYRNLLFRSYNQFMFDSISPLDWYEPIDESDRRFAALSSQFKSVLKKNCQLITPDFIKLPLIFYIVSPTDKEGLRVHLACPSFESGFSYGCYSLHDGSIGGRNNEEIETLVQELREAWQAEVKPALDCMFPRRQIVMDDAAEIVAPVAEFPVVTALAPIEKPAGSETLLRALHASVKRICEPRGRYGAYVTEILEDQEFWQAVEPLGIMKRSSAQETLELIKGSKVEVTSFAVSGGTKDYIYLKSLTI